MWPSYACDNLLAIILTTHTGKRHQKAKITLGKEIKIIGHGPI